MPICPVCRQDVGTRVLDGQTVLQAHFRPGAAPPCPGSNQPPARPPDASLFESEQDPPMRRYFGGVLVFLAAWTLMVSARQPKNDQLILMAAAGAVFAGFAALLLFDPPDRT